MTDGRLISSIYKELLEGKKSNVKLSKRFKKVILKNKNKWLNKEKKCQPYSF